MENAEKILVFHFEVGRHASFPQKTVVKKEKIALQRRFLCGRPHFKHALPVFFKICGVASLQTSKITGIINQEIWLSKKMLYDQNVCQNLRVAIPQVHYLACSEREREESI